VEGWRSFCFDFTFETTLGDINIFGEVGWGGYVRRCKKEFNRFKVFGMMIPVLAIPSLIALKNLPEEKKMNR
jgi:hypothetical protein